MTNPTCDTCRFMCGDDNGGDGVVCQRYPPVVTTTNAGCFPSTHKTWFCGEHQPVTASEAGSQDRTQEIDTLAPPT